MITKTKGILSLASVASLLLLGTTLTPVFATSSTNSGPYSPNYETPSYHSSSCDGSLGQTCGRYATTGVNQLYATSSSSSLTALVDNNEDFTTFTVGSSPSVTTSGNAWFNAEVTYGGYLTIPSGSSADYVAYLSMWDANNGDLGNCGSNVDVTSEGLQSATVVIDNCQYSNNVSDTYYAGVQHEVDVSSNSGTISDFWNSNYNAQTNSITVCDSSC